MATARRDLMVVGASAGGLGPMSSLLRVLPNDLPAAIVAVIHQMEQGTNILLEALRRAVALPVEEARPGTALEPGRIYVPPLDHHVLVTNNHLDVSRGPKENFARPAIDPLFRSAARSHGARTMGVILSGTLDDGTAGLLAIKRRGGVALVQDPMTALQPGMPQSALEFVDVDHVAGPEQLGERLAALAGTPVPAGPSRAIRDGEVRVQQEGDTDMDLVNSLGTPSAFSCPSCNGVLWEIQDGDLVRYRCHAGHAFGVGTLAQGKEDTVEMALWTAIRALKEKAEIGKRIANRARDHGQEDQVRRSEERVQFLERQVLALRELIEKL